MRMSAYFFMCLISVQLSIFNALYVSAKPLRVLFCMRRFPSNTSWFVLNQMVKFIQQGHEITIFTKKLDNASINTTHPDITAYRLLEKTYTEVPPGKKFDLILCQSAYLAPLVMELKERKVLTGKLVVFIREAFKGDALLAVRKKVFDGADLIMPVCQHFKNALIELGCSATKIIVLHSTIDCTQFSYRRRLRHGDEPIRVITTSRISEKKGIYYGIKAIEHLVKKYPTIQYTVLGNGILRPYLEKLIQHLGLEDNIRIVGWKTPKEVAQELTKSHIFIHPSIQSKKGHQEGIPNALMEAMATGLPVISTWHGGIPELVQDKLSGFLVPEKDSKALAERIDYLIQHPELWGLMGHTGRQYVEENFNKEKENNKLIAICLRLTQDLPLSQYSAE